MSGYLTVKHDAHSEFEDRKSVFYGDVQPVKTEEEALSHIASVKKKYPDARHHVYAYILNANGSCRFSDDGEPSGTAGKPVLDCIKKAGISDVCCVVTRYFGGTLLGTGGLVHAYTEAASTALRLAEPAEMKDYSVIRFSVGYSEYQKILPLFEKSGFQVEGSVFSTEVSVTGRIEEEKAEPLQKAVSDLTNGRFSAYQIGKKKDF